MLCRCPTFPANLNPPNHPNILLCANHAIPCQYAAPYQYGKKLSNIFVNPQVPVCWCPAMFCCKTTLYPKYHTPLSNELQQPCHSKPLLAVAMVLVPNRFQPCHKHETIKHAHDPPPFPRETQSTPLFVVSTPNTIIQNINSSNVQDKTKHQRAASISGTLLLYQAIIWSSHGDDAADGDDEKQEHVFSLSASNTSCGA